MLAVVTVLARTFSLAEFGLYGLLIALASYMLVLQASVEGATVRAIARSPTQEGRNTVFSTAIVLYAAFGLVSGVVIAGLGVAVVGVLDIAPELQPSAREGLLALGVVTAVGWPFRAFQDALRGSQRFTASSAAEIAAPRW
jgi:O-antigen/teichoic acid export membrane protein